MEGKKLFRRLAEKSRAHGHRLIKSAGAISLCVAALVYIFTTNVAFAVTVNGEFVGYAEDVSQIDSAVSSVSRTVSDALGYAYPVDQAVSYQMTLATGDVGISQAVEEKLLNGLDVIGEYAILCIDGEPFCAFETTGDASAALAAYIELFSGENVDSARFLENVTIKVDYADSQLLAATEDFDIRAHAVLHVETISHLHEEEVIPYESETVYDDTMYEDEMIVEQAGREGRHVSLIEEKAVNGLIVSREVTAEPVQVDPVKEIIRVGTKEHISTGTYLWPSDGILTSYFGRRYVEIGSSNHKGLDIASSYGAPITASDGGVVIMAEYYFGYGNLVQIQHENGDVTYYGHCSKLLVNVGDVVRQGDEIAKMGSTGAASGVHVHFEYRPGGGDPVDPLQVLPERED